VLETAVQATVGGVTIEPILTDPRVGLFVLRIAAPP
jgi:hypothetical protein